MDLKTVGTHNYFEHPSTEVLCVAFARGNAPVELWVPAQEEEADRKAAFIQALEDADEVWAHNAAFERQALRWFHRRHGVPLAPEVKWRCTMVAALAMSLPGSLENAAGALGLEVAKDMEGRRIGLQLCKPKSTAISRKGEAAKGRVLKGGDAFGGWVPDSRTVVDRDGNEWWADPALFRRLYDYCVNDVVVERQLHSRLLHLTPAEQALWHVDQTINDRGFQIDVDAAIRAERLALTETSRMNAEMSRLTGGRVATCQSHTALAGFLGLSSVDKAAVVAALENPETSPLHREVLALRQEAARSSVAKLRTMIERGPRARGTLQFHGANTGRWAGRAIQPHNMPRGTLHMSPETMDRILREELGDRDRLELVHGAPLAVISDCLRSFIVAAPGCEFLCADFAAIEARVNAWLAGEAWKLKAFADGVEIYCLVAEKLFKRPVDPDADPELRQRGKVADLAFGYGGGVGAGHTMGANYGLHLPDDEWDRLKVAWREQHLRITRFWADLQTAAIDAVLSSGYVKYPGPDKKGVCFLRRGSFLFCRLPSGRALCYPYPRIDERPTPWGETSPSLSYMSSDAGQWRRGHTYGGSLCENVVQAVSRDLLAEFILRCEARGWPVVLHVHDEVVVEAPVGSVDLNEFLTEACVLPAWAPGLPMAAKGWRGQRYRKD